MRRRSLFFLLLIVLVGSLNKAAAVDLALRITGIDEPVKLVVEASATDSKEVIKASGRVQSGAVLHLNLAGNHIWEIAGSVVGYWTPGQTIFLREDQEEDAIFLKFWPTTSVNGHFSLADKASKPQSLRAYFQPSPDAGDENPPEGSVRCEVLNSDFSCDLPLGKWDLKIRAPGFVSHFFWGKVLKGGKALELGTLRLKQGGSIMGFVSLEGHPRHGLDACRVELREVKTGHEQKDDLEERLNEKAEMEKVNSRGFFHFQGVAPGIFELNVTHPDLAPERVFPVEVRATAETEIQPAIALRPFSSLDVSLAPSEDSVGEPWTVELLDWRLGTPIRASVGQAAAVGGYLHIGGLRRGVFMLVVKDSRGAKYAYRRVDLSSASLSITVDIDMLEIRGRVLLGDHPISATLSFSESGLSDKHGKENPLRIIGPVYCNEKGEFEDYLPAEGRYKVVITSDEPRLTRTLHGIDVLRPPGRRFARVDIDLPDTELRGKVIDGDQKGVEDARVQILSTDGGIGLEVLHSDEDGRFHTFGVTPGQYRIQAFEGDRASETALISIDEDQAPAPLTLVLKEQTTFEGTVFDEMAPVVGARVEVIVSAVTKAAMTGVDGSFSIALPGLNGTELPFAILAPGRNLHIGRAQVQAEAPPTRIFLTQRGGGIQFTNPSSRNHARLAWLVSSSGFVFGSTIDSWASLHGMPLVSTAAEGFIPALEPGPYTICALKMDELFSLLSSVSMSPLTTISSWTQTHPKACQSGEVFAGGIVKIDLPLR